MAVVDDREDMILAMHPNYMEEIVRGEKNYEFRKYMMKPNVKRIWFYLTAPGSLIKYICEINPGRTRNEGDEPLPENGLGNREYNTHHKDWDGYDYAYEILSLYELTEPITLAEMKDKHGFKGAPMGRVYVPPSMLEAVPWYDQKKIRSFVPISQTAPSETK